MKWWCSWNLHYSPNLLVKNHGENICKFLKVRAELETVWIIQKLLSFLTLHKNSPKSIYHVAKNAIYPSKHSKGYLRMLIILIFLKREYWLKWVNCASNMQNHGKEKVYYCKFVHGVNSGYLFVVLFTF